MRDSWKGLLAPVLVALAVTALIVGVGARAAADRGQVNSLPAPGEVREAIEGQKSSRRDRPKPDLRAAKTLPHRDLSRQEAETLLSGVFDSNLQATAGVYGDLEARSFLSNHVAVVDSSDGKAASGSSLEPDSALLYSSYPLRTPSRSGRVEAISLDLERTEYGFRAANPLTDVEVPRDISEGFTLPGITTAVDLAGTPERAASLSEPNVAFYPNVAPDTDFALTPTPTGVEAFAHLRTPEAPLTQRYDLDLPDGDVLRAEGNGALVTRDGETLMAIPPPTSMDAAGKSVPTELTVVESSISVTVRPSAATTTYPILVDPVFQAYDWYGTKKTDAISFGEVEGWGAKKSSGGMFQFGSSVPGTELQPTVPYNATGLYLASLTTVATGAEAYWAYPVPRYYSDAAAHQGRRPDSFISKFTVNNWYWKADSEYRSPYVYMGLWGPTTGWLPNPYSHEGLKGHTVNGFSPNWPLVFENPLKVPDYKVALVGMYSNETTSKASWAYLYVGGTVVEFDEPAGNVPDITEASEPEAWLNQANASVVVAAQDTGLGVRAIKVVSSQGATPPSWSVTHSCTGVPTKACPYAWKTNVNIEPSKLPTGISRLKVIGEDPIGRVSTREIEGQKVDAGVEVKVDHTSPSVALSGPATEQATLGKKWPTYALNLSATDGTTVSPQSGAAKLSLKVDGKTEFEIVPGCPTENCRIDRSWTLESSKYSPGTHTVSVAATDAVGNLAERTLSVTLEPTPPPQLSVTGSATQQASLGTSRPRYNVSATATALAAVSQAPGPPTLVQELNGVGQSGLPMMQPSDVALDPKGNLWVLDKTAGRVQQFDPNGKFVRSVGQQGSGYGQLLRPSALASDAMGNIWIADSGNSRITAFKPEGQVMTTFGSPGSGVGQLANPEGIALDKAGNVWVADTNNYRIVKFTSGGAVLRTIPTSAQLFMPNSIEIGPAGEVWATDAMLPRATKLSETGTPLGTFGNSVLKEPSGIAVDNLGHLFVGDASTDRVFEWNVSNGQLIAEFGKPGSGAGEMALLKPTGITTDASRGIWIADGGRFRAEKWRQRAVSASEITLKIKLDGTLKASETKVCEELEQCSAIKAWTMESAGVSAGNHTITVESTDGYGRTSLKTIELNVQRDLTEPALTATGPLREAPSGWVEQESYGLQASASDAGYGVTCLIFKLDGATVASKTQSCADGGCSATLAASVDMNKYTGGSHPAELVAVDGAGNRKTTNWTVNVNPDGQISTSEAVATLEATESTAVDTPVAPNSEILESEQIENGENPEFKTVGSTIESVGATNKTTMTMNPEGGFTIHGPSESTTITQKVSGTASPVSTASGVAAVSTNTATQVDSVVRPVFNGDQTFQAIRSANCPAVVSWTVQLRPGQSLKLVNGQYAQVLSASGEVNILISAEEAHDATGVPVPTALSVSGNVLSLTIDCATQAFVLPIVAGQGWETAYKQPIIVKGPEDETEIFERERREREAREREAAMGESIPPPPNELTQAYAQEVLRPSYEGSNEIVPAPLPPAGGASASAARIIVVHEQRTCSSTGCSVWNMRMPDGPVSEHPHYIHGRTKSGDYYSEWIDGTSVRCWDHWSDWLAVAAELHVRSEGCGFFGPWKVVVGEKRHLTLWHDAEVGMWVITRQFQFYEQGCYGLNIRIWPNGKQEKVVHDRDCLLNVQ